MRATKPAVLIIIGSILFLLHFISHHFFNNHYLTVGFLVVGVPIVAYGIFLSVKKKPSV